MLLYELTKFYQVRWVFRLGNIYSPFPVVDYGGIQFITVVSSLKANGNSCNSSRPILILV